MPRTEPKRGRRSPAARYQRTAIAFLAVVGLLAVFVLLSSLGRVRVRITPRVEPMAADAEVLLVASGTPGDRELLGRLLRVDGTASVRLPIGAVASEPVVTARPEPAPAPEAPASGPPVRAHGTVTLTNTQQTPQPLVATTRLLASDGVLFRLVKGVVIPAKGQLDGVVVAADQPGAVGNIGPTKFTIPGLSTWLQVRVWAESAEPMSGGAGSGPVPAPVRHVQQPAPALVAAGGSIVRAEDIVAARARATDVAREDAQRRVLAAAQPWEQAVVVDAATTVHMDGTAGDRRSQVQADAVATVTAILVDRKALAAAAQHALEGEVAARGRALLRARTDAMTTRVIRYDAATARATIAVHLEGDAVLRASAASFDTNRIVGFTPDAVRTYLKSIPGIADVDVHLSPFWVTRVPANAGSVEVEVRQPMP